METASKVVGMFFSDETISTNNSSEMGKHLLSKQSMGNSGIVHNLNEHHIRVDLQTFVHALFTPKKMATLTFKMALLKIGIALYILAWIENFNTWVGGAMSILGCFAVAAYIWLTYQKARSLKIKNDADEFHLNLKKYGDK